MRTTEPQLDSFQRKTREFQGGNHGIKNGADCGDRTRPPQPRKPERSEKMFSATIAGYFSFGLQKNIGDELEILL